MSRSPSPKIFVECPEVEKVTSFVSQAGDLLGSLPEREGLNIRARLPHRTVLAGDAGGLTVKAVMTEVEGAMQRLLSKLDAVRMLAAFRRLGRSTENDDPSHLGWVNGRKTGELAILKYAAPSSLLDGVGSGIVFWTFSDPELLAVARLRLLSILFYDLTAAYRKIGKGMALRVGREWPLKLVPADATSRKTLELIDRWERRVEVFPTSLVGALGQVEGKIITPDSEIILAASWRRLDDKEPVTIGPYTLADDGALFHAGLSSLPQDILNFRHLEPVFQKLWSVSFRDLLDAMSVFSLSGMGLSRFQGRRFDLESFHLSLITLTRRGYILGLWPEGPELLLRSQIVAKLGGRQLPDDVSEGLHRAVKLLTLDPSTIHLQDRTPHAPVYRFGTRFVYDADAAGLFIPSLLRNLRAEDPFQDQANRQIEGQVHAKLSPFGTQPFSPGKMIRIAGRELTDLDASVVRHGVLIAADTYSSPKDTALDQGDYKRTRNRATELHAKLTKWRGKMKEMANAGSRLNFDLQALGISHILPVVVTAAVEWIATDATDVWLNERTPAILSSDELCSYIETAEASVLQRSSIPVGGP